VKPRNGRRPEGPPVRIAPLTTKRWTDLQSLFSESATTDGCQCTWFFRTGPEFRDGYGPGNRNALYDRVLAGGPPGVLAYVGGAPAAWCAFGPREWYPRVDRSRLFRGVGRPGTWAIVCFFVPNRFRGSRLMDRLIEAAVERASEAGASAVEAYPVVVEPGGRTDPGSGYHGFVGPFLRSGFPVVGRPSPARAVVRKELPGASLRGGRRREGGPGPRAAAPTSRGSRPSATRVRRPGSRRPGRRPTRGTAAE